MVMEVGDVWGVVIAQTLESELGGVLPFLVRKVLARRRAQDDVGDRMRHLLAEIEAADLADLTTEFGRRHTVEVGGQKPRSLLAREVVEKSPGAVAAIDHPDHRNPRPKGWLFPAWRFAVIRRSPVAVEAPQASEKWSRSADEAPERDGRRSPAGRLD
jgi:hypothetical protein